VVIANTGLHGIYVDDNSASDASVAISMVQTLVENTGLGGFDEDGVRVDERGDGDIIFTSTASEFIAAGADGVELDEGGDGDVIFDVVNTDFIDNGNFCSFRLQESPLAIVSDGEIEVEVPIGDFADADAILTALGADETQAACLEDGIEDDGDVWVIGIDLDDAFDIDEAGGGSIAGTVKNATLLDNYDEGLDFDEEDDGDIIGTAVSVRAFGNVDEAIKYSEEGGGSVTATVSGTRSDGDLEFEEADAGDVDAKITGSAFDDIALVEEGPGSLTYRLFGTSYDDLEVESTD
jgi:hypothetical protein